MSTDMAPPTLPTEVSQPTLANTNGTVKTKDVSTSKPLPKLPIPKLEDSCERYLRALQGLQDPEEHEKTKKIVQDFMTSGEGEKWQKRLIEYDAGVESYIEEFWCEFVRLGRMSVTEYPR
jgi:carnitine O-acetyltransferase